MKLFGKRKIVEQRPETLEGDFRELSTPVSIKQNAILAERAATTEWRNNPFFVAMDIEKIEAREKWRKEFEENAKKCDGCIWNRFFYEMGSSTQICNYVDDLEKAAREVGRSTTCENRVTWEEARAYVEARKNAP